MAHRELIDAHHHFWDTERANYPWMTDEVAPIRRPFGPQDLRPLLQRCNVAGTVLVQARSDLEETEWFLDIAEDVDFVWGVVGWVDLAAPGVGDELSALQERGDGRALVGVRHQAHDEPDERWLVRPEVLRGLAAVGDAGLAYDLLVRTRELPAAVDAARSLPDVRFVVDHLAKPPIATGETEAWARAMAPLAELDNVYCKLSGMITEADWRAWTPEHLRPYVDRVLHMFGSERVMFGSDWPVCLLAGSYEEGLAALDACLGELDAATRDKIFRRNAQAFYRLASRPC